MASWFVRPETATLPLSEGHTLEVRQRLTAGEQRDRFDRMSSAGIDGDLTIKRLQVGMATITAYLLNWTLTDDDGRLVAIKGLSMDDLAATIDQLAPERFAELLEAIERHEAATASLKKTDGASAS